VNPSKFGDSYDLVKRFFCGELSALGYEIRTDSMFTGDWGGQERQFLRLIGARPMTDASRSSRTALLLDPDTGVNTKGSSKHVSIDRLVREASRHRLVFSFDQSFSRRLRPSEVMAVMAAKLAALQKGSCHGLYYDSHAHFLFVSKTAETLREISEHLVSIGLPKLRMVSSSDRA
jgi:hypothetical protein